MTGRRVLVAGVAGVAVGLLAGCAQAPEPVPGSLIGQTWQVSNIYIEPGMPSSVSGAASGTVHLVFGETSATGSTGCAPLQATVRFTHEGEEVAADDATAVEFTDVTIRDPAGAGVECEGTRSWTHEEMSRLLVSGNAFDITTPDPTGMVLTLQAEEVDPPALRLVRL